MGYVTFRRDSFDAGAFDANFSTRSSHLPVMKSEVMFFCLVETGRTISNALKQQSTDACIEFAVYCSISLQN